EQFAFADACNSVLAISVAERIIDLGSHGRLLVLAHNDCVPKEQSSGASAVDAGFVNRGGRTVNNPPPRGRRGWRTTVCDGRVQCRGRSARAGDLLRSLWFRAPVCSPNGPRAWPGTSSAATDTLARRLLGFAARTPGRTSACGRRARQSCAQWRRPPWR